MVSNSVLLKIENDLKEEKIEYKLKIMNNHIRLSLNNLDGCCVSLNRDMNIKNYYKILIKKSDEELARKILLKYKSLI